MPTPPSTPSPPAPAPPPPASTATGASAGPTPSPSAGRMRSPPGPRCRSSTPTTLTSEDALTQARGQSSLQAKLRSPSKPPSRRPLPRTPASACAPSGTSCSATSFPEGLLPPMTAPPALASVYSLLRDADLTFLNLEGPLCDGGSTNKCPQGRQLLRLPLPYLLRQVPEEAGVDLASTANNHSGDFGELCRRETRGHPRPRSASPGAGPRAPSPPSSATACASAWSPSTPRPRATDLNNTATAKALVRSVAETQMRPRRRLLPRRREAPRLSTSPRAPRSSREDRATCASSPTPSSTPARTLVLGHGPTSCAPWEFYRGAPHRLLHGQLRHLRLLQPARPPGPGPWWWTWSSMPGAAPSPAASSPTRQEGKGIPVPDPRASDCPGAQPERRRTSLTPAPRSPPMAPSPHRQGCGAGAE